jgi:photosystem II oxygen-evolving enhancer protein 1
MKVAIISTLLFGADALQPTKPAVAQKLATDVAAGILAAGVSFAGPAVLSANAITSEVRNQLSYEQVKGTGLANRCNEVVGKDSISVPGSGYSLVDVCLEPKTWQVEEQVANKKGDVSKQFVNTKLMTRQTYTLDGISGKLTGGSGITFTEEDGIDYAPTTVQLPGGERVPFLFTVKELVAKGNGGAFKPGYEFGGTFKVPSYRTGLFLDPKGRGMTTGYDQAQALIASQTGTDSQGELEGEINKVFDVFDGTIEFAVSQVNAAEGEIGGVFVSSQASDTDLGSKTPKKVLSKGIFYGRVVKD